jgi:ABC-type lipoprotein export system ATPase subunit
MTTPTSTEEALAALMGEPGETAEPDGDSSPTVRTLTVTAGHDKAGAPEEFDELTFRTGDVVCVVGATGSGKSRLLADIEWLAQADTPTGRSIRINSETPDVSGRYAGFGRLVAQLSQNMNFVMDATVGEFLHLHGESRGLLLGDGRAEEIITAANGLTGEPLSAERQLTELSGGQSRAPMIADTALLSTSPIILIDEIENAGIDRHEAIALLQGADKIVLVATHDPSLALTAPRRLVLSNGGNSQVRRHSHTEDALARAPAGVWTLSPVIPASRPPRFCLKNAPAPDRISSL